MAQCLITHTPICTIFSFTQPKCYEPLLPDEAVFLQAARLLHPFVFHVLYLQAMPVLLSSRGVRTARQRKSVEIRLLSPLRSHSDWRTCLRLSAAVVALSVLHKLKEASVTRHSLYGFTRRVKRLNMLPASIMSTSHGGRFTCTANCYSKLSTYRSVV